MPHEDELRATYAPYSSLEEILNAGILPEDLPIVWTDIMNYDPDAVKRQEQVARDFAALPDPFDDTRPTIKF